MKAIMSLSEFIDEIAFHIYHNPLPNTWQQASLIATSAINPHMEKRKQLKPFAFVPIRKVRINTDEQDQIVADRIIAKLLKAKNRECP